MVVSGLLFFVMHKGWKMVIFLVLPKFCSYLNSYTLLCHLLSL